MDKTLRESAKLWLKAIVFVVSFCQFALGFDWFLPLYLCANYGILLQISSNQLKLCFKEKTEPIIEGDDRVATYRFIPYILWGLVVIL